MCMMNLMHHNDEVMIGPRFWRSGPLQRGLLVRMQGLDGTWLVASKLGMACAVLWPVESMDIEAHPTPLKLWGPKPIQFFWEMNVSYVHELKDWTVIPYMFISPARIWLEMDRKLPKELPPMFMLQLGKKDPSTA